MVLVVCEASGASRISIGSSLDLQLRSVARANVDPRCAPHLHLAAKDARLLPIIVLSGKTIEIIPRFDLNKLVPTLTTSR